MGSTERRAREKAELRTKILDAGRELLVKEGYDALTMRKVADKIEYSPTAIYLHFADKAALLQEIIATDFAALAGQFQKLARIEDPIERLVKCGRAYVDFGIAHPSHYKLMFSSKPPADFDRSKQDEVKGDPNRDSYAFMREIVAQCMKKKLFRPEIKDVELVAQTLWAAMHGIVSLTIDQSEKDFIAIKKPRDIAGLMLDVLMRGMIA